MPINSKGGFGDPVRGVRQSIVTGTVVGRTSSGRGAAELIPIVTLAHRVRQTGLAGGGGASSLKNLLDVNVTEGAGIDGEALAWNNATSKWIAKALVKALTDLSDVNVTEGTAIDGQVLTWHNATSKWIAAAATAAAALTASGAWGSTTAYAVGDVVTYNGGYFVCSAAVAAPAAGDNFDPSKSSSGITLSNSNYTATANNGSGDKFAAGLQGYSTGKLYFETSSDFYTGTGTDSNVGLAPSGDLSASACTNAIYVQGYSTDAVYIAGSNQGALGFAGTSLLCWAVDYDNKLIWIRQGASGQWNGSGTANPAAGTGGFSFSTLTGPFYFFSRLQAASSGSGDYTTYNPGDTTFTGAVPSGFTAAGPAGANSPPSSDTSHWVQVASQLATGSAPGIVQPDGTTITISGGVISAAGGGSSTPWYWNPPTAASFPTLIGTATPTLTDDSDVGLIVDGGSPVTGDVVRLALKALPAAGTDFTATARIVINGIAANYAGGGLALYDSVAANKCVFLKHEISGSQSFEVSYFSVPSGYNSNPMSLATFDRILWYRIARVGTALYFYYSMNGKHWVQGYTAAQTAWLANAPSHIGLGIWYNRSSSPVDLTVDHWDQTW